MVEAPRRSAHAGSLVAFALATCNVSLLLLAILIPAYRGGALGESIEDVGTPLGLVLFALLWASTVWATNGALRGLGRLEDVRLLEACQRGGLWGGWNGVVVFLALLGAAITAIWLDAAFGPGSSGLQLREVPVAVLAFAAYGTVGSVIAFLVGAAIGLMTTIVDLLFLVLARLALRSAKIRQLLQNCSIL